MASLCRFSSPTPSHFVTVTDDNRIKLWDVAHNRLQSQFMERDHLTAGYTCLAWRTTTTADATDATKKQKKNKKKGNKKAQQQQQQLGLLAVGTNSGRIVVWDLQRGEVAMELSDASHTQPITGVAFGPDGKKIVSTSTGKKVLVWDTESRTVAREMRFGSPHASTVAVTNDAIVACGKQLRTYDLASLKKLTKRDAHPDQANVLAVAPTANVVFTATSDLFLSAWDPRPADDADGDVSSGQPLATFRAPSAVTAVAIADADRASPGASLTVAATTKDGKAVVWDFPLAAGAAAASASGGARSAAKAVAPNCVVSPSGSSMPVVATAFQAAAGGAGRLVVAQGDMVRPVFETTGIRDEDGALVATVEVVGVTDESNRAAKDGEDDDSDDEDGARAGAGAGTGAAKGDAAVVGSEDMATLRGSMHPTDADKPLSKKRSRGDDDDDDDDADDDDDDEDNLDDASDAELQEFEKMLLGGDNLDDAGLDDDGLDDEFDDEDDEDDYGESTLQERLDDLQRELDAEEAVDAEATAEEEALAEAERARVAGLLKAGAAPNVSTLSSILVQALKTNDASQLEMCLAATDDKVIKETVERLPASQVVTFLTTVISKFEAKPSRGLALSRWIRAVMVHHAAHLMSVPDLVNRLTGLYQTIDSRVKVFKKLLTLSGRLDIVMSQVSHQKDGKGGAAGGAGAGAGGERRATTFLVGEDDDDDDVEEESEDEEEDEEEDDDE